jgi:hypothetical protein
MRWIIGGIWLAAWSIWFVVGVGLHLQLPRAVGMKVSEIPLPSTERLVGFLKDRRELLVQPEQFMRPIQLNVYNAETGAVTRAFSLGDRIPQLPLSTCRTHNVVVARGQGRQTMGLEVMDLQDGRWMRVTDKTALNAAVHPTQPWIAFRETSGPADKRRQLAVVDWTTGAEVFSLPASPDLIRAGTAFFLPDGRRLAIPVVRKSLSLIDGEPPTVLEIWSLDEPRRRGRTVRIPKFQPRLQMGGAGRVAWLRHRKNMVRDVAVYDLDADREVFSKDWEYDLSVTIGSEEYFLSRSGRTLFGGSPPSVWDVDSGAHRWNPTPERHVNGGNQDLDAFTVFETWDQPWTRGKLKHWNTVALHDLDSAEFRFRCWEGDAAILSRVSDDGGLGVVVGPKNVLAVWRLPFRVNWLLLVLCQAILALPMVLVWAAIQWRKRRRRE